MFKKVHKVVKDKVTNIIGSAIDYVHSYSNKKKKDEKKKNPFTINQEFSYLISNEP